MQAGLLINDLVRIDFTMPDSGWRFSPHLHHYFQFDAILDGQVDVLLGDRSVVRLKAGDGFFIPPLVRHGYNARKRFEQGSFKFHLNPRYWSYFSMRAQRVRLSPALRALIRATGRRYRAGAPLTQQQTAAVLTMCLVESLAGLDATKPRHDDSSDSLCQLLWPLLERIEKDPSRDWSVADMAAACHLSPDYFARCFHRILRQTPRHYLRSARMRAAAMTLQTDPSKPIKQVADEAGYATVHSFTRAFKQTFGMGPAAYRDAMP